MTEETSKRAKIERLARKMCQVSTALSPDHLYVKGEQIQAKDGYVIFAAELKPLWTAFLPEAIVAHDEIEQARARRSAPEDEEKSGLFDFHERPSDEDVKAARSWREKQGLA